jgi:hypothetical protein
VEERESGGWEYNSVQQSTTERIVSRRMRMRTERVLGSQERRVGLKIDCEFL